MDAKTNFQIKLIHAIEQHPNGMSIEEVAAYLGRDVTYVKSCIKKEIAIIMSNPKIAKQIRDFTKKIKGDDQK